MTQIFLDTNIFIEVFARRGEKSDKCKKILGEKKNLYTTSPVVAEVEWVLRSGYNIGKTMIVRCLKKVLTSDIDIQSKKLLINSLDYYQKNNIDWTDCVNMFMLKDLGIDKAYSYDRGLSKFDWVERLEP